MMGDEVLNDIKKPQIYIITPCYNSEQTIEQTIMSVYLQYSDVNITYHIQDGGSTDGTLQLLKKWEEIFQTSRANITFSFVSEPDSGMYDAISKGFDRFSILDKDWMCWINSDDQLSGLFSKTIAGLSRSYPEVQWLTGRTAVFDKQKKLHTHDRFYSNLFFIQQEGTCWKASLWGKCNGKSLLSNYKLAGDFALWVNFAKHTQIYQVQHPMGFFNMRDGQLSASQFDNYIKETLFSTDLNEASKHKMSNEIKNFQSHNLYLIDDKVELKIEKITVGLNKKVTIVDEYVT